MKKVKLLLVLLIIFLIGWFGGQRLRAHSLTTPGVTYIVTKFSDDNGPCEPDDCALREAIIAANATTSHDAINLSAGTYTLTLSGDDDTALLGDLDILHAVDIIGAGMETTIIDAEATNDRVFHVLGGPVLFENITVANGYNSNPGGGIFNAFQQTTINNCILHNNRTYFNGGGIYNQGILSITNSTINNNSVTHNLLLGTGGGGIYNSGTLTITNSILSGNSANTNRSGGSLGGGIYNSDSESTLTIINSTLSNNSAEGNGGGVMSAGSVSIVGSTLNGNSAQSGGAIYHLGLILSINNSTISNNLAKTLEGGGVSLAHGELHISNSTVNGNSAEGENEGEGGGIWVGDEYETALYLVNTIIANSISGGDCVVKGVFPTNIKNLIEDGSCSPAFSGDPKLLPLDNYGGPTQTHALNEGSLAIDEGDVHACPTKDQRDYLRTGLCDIGAYEYAGHLDIYLPTILNNYITYFDGPWEIEPNNTSTQANGPIHPGQDYFGYPNDQKDYFSFISPAAGDVTIHLTGHTGENVQLQLFYESTNNRVAYVVNSPYLIALSDQPAGTYYVYIFTGSGFNSDNQYTVRVTYPTAP